MDIMEFISVLYISKTWLHQSAFFQVRTLKVFTTGTSATSCRPCCRRIFCCAAFSYSSIRRSSSFRRSSVSHRVSSCRTGGWRGCSDDSDGYRLWAMSLSQYKLKSNWWDGVKNAMDRLRRERKPFQECHADKHAAELTHPAAAAAATTYPLPAQSLHHCIQTVVGLGHGGGDAGGRPSAFQLLLRVDNLAF